jgi:hypothetical protein
MDSPLLSSNTRGRCLLSCCLAMLWSNPLQLYTHILYIHIHTWQAAGNTMKALPLSVHVYTIYVSRVPHVSSLPCCLFCSTSGRVKTCCQFCQDGVCTDCLTQSPKETSYDVKTNDSRKQKMSCFNLILLLLSGRIRGDISTRLALYKAFA